MNIQKTSFGSDKPYTRHQGNCPHRNERNHNPCHCAKWLYVNRKGYSPRRLSLSTPSWAEAQRIAADTLRGWDPDIAAGRQKRA